MLTESSGKAVTCQLSSAIGGAAQSTGLLLVDGVVVSSHYARVNRMGGVQGWRWRQGAMNEKLSRSLYFMLVSGNSIFNVQCRLWRGWMPFVIRGG